MSGWQLDGSTLPRHTWDVAVVGGGPAGSIAALHLARRGFSVVILERHAYPRDKVCGDALIADSIRVLERAGLLDKVASSAFVTNSLRVYSPSRFVVDIRARTLVVPRMEFDELLAREAAAAGAVVARATVERIEPGRLARIALRELQNPLEARIAIVATGADIRLLAPLGMVDCATPSVIAVRRYVHSKIQIDQLVFTFERAIAPGYAWLFPMRDGIYNVGCGTAYGGNRINLAAALDFFLHRFPPLRSFSDGITREEPIRGAILRCGLKGTKPFLAPNVIAIGETIGATFPFTGEGIGKAMETGERAAAVVAEALEGYNLSRLASFAAEVDELRHRYRSYELAERWLARPWLADLVMLLAQRSRYAISCAEAVLNETGDPRQIFSVRGLWNMLRN